MDYGVDPLRCPQRGRELAKIAVIKAPVDLSAILGHLNLWEEPPARAS